MTPPVGTMWRFTQAETDRTEAEGRIYYSKSGMPYVKSYLDERKGRAAQNLWTDIVMSKSGAERLGYPTQKPLALLERIIEATSNPGEVVLDPFCGCGTALVAAQRLGREWVGIDVTHLSIAVMRARLRDSFPALGEVTVIGQPNEVDGARMLAAQSLDGRYEGTRIWSGHANGLRSFGLWSSAMRSRRSSHVAPGFFLGAAEILPAEPDAQRLKIRSTPAALRTPALLHRCRSCERAA
ncbi:MAG: site-specific DNA-methyltransferase [Chloroflexota bacterium]|nr:site-specific DNA-methyltransferase [Chloroflexota bacterium]